MQAPGFHRLIVTFQQGQAQITGDIGLFVIGIGQWAGGQNANARAKAAAQFLQRVAVRPEEARKPVNIRAAIKLWKDAGGSDAVFKRKACPRWRIGAVRQNPPATIRPTANLEGSL